MAAISNAYGNLYGNLSISGNSLWTTATTTSQAYAVSDFGALTFGSAPEQRKKTNLDWLDERVNEMRVKL